MDIGKPKRIYTIEPVEDPVPRETPTHAPGGGEPVTPPPQPIERPGNSR
jgi:hypothetical protein